MKILGCGSNHYGHHGCCRDLPVGKISLVALSLIFIGVGIGAYFWGSQLLPQIFTTSAQQIAISAGIVGIGVLLDIGLLIHYCMKKCQQQEKKVSVSQPPQTADLSRLKVHYFKDVNGHFFLTLGEANLNRLIRNEKVSVPAVIVERREKEVHIQAINGVLCREKRNLNHFRFYKPEEIPALSCKAEWTVPSDSEKIPIMIIFDDKFINTWS